jgi:hypothetical protein
VSHSCACIGSPCLSQCVHGAPIGGGGLSVLEDFFFEHMQVTYGEEWVALHVVHGIFLAIEKHRAQVTSAHARPGKQAG